MYISIQLLLSLLILYTNAQQLKTLYYPIVASNVTKATHLFSFTERAVPYAALYIDIIERDFMYNQSLDLVYEYYYDFRSPVITSIRQFVPKPSLVAYAHYYEPCGSPGLIQGDHVFFVNYTASTNMDTPFTGNGSFSYMLESTLVTVPHMGVITGNGWKRYRTVIMDPIGGELSVTLSADFNISSVITHVIFATGAECIDTFNISSPDHFVRAIPTLETVKTWTEKIPLKGIWYIGFLTLSNSASVNLEIVHIPAPSPPPGDNNSGLAAGLSIGIVLVIIFSVVAYVWWKRRKTPYRSLH